MKKRIIALMVAVMVAFGFGASAMEAADGPQIRVHGEFLDFPGGQPPVIVEGRTMVPLRDVMERLGFEVEWHAEYEMIGLWNEYVGIALWIGFEYMSMDGNDDDLRPLDVAPMLLNGRTMVPVRAIAEATGFDVVWDFVDGIVDIWEVGEMPELLPIPQDAPSLSETISSITLPMDRVMSREEIDAWRAEYLAMGGVNAWEWDLLRRLNAERARRGIHELEVNLELMEAARFAAQTWDSVNPIPWYLMPTDEEGNRVFAQPRLSSSGPLLVPINEMARIMDSVHRDIALAYRYREVGVGAYMEASGRLAWTLAFL